MPPPPSTHPPQNPPTDQPLPPPPKGQGRPQGKAKPNPVEHILVLDDCISE